MLTNFALILLALEVYFLLAILVVAPPLLVVVLLLGVEVHTAVLLMLVLAVVANLAKEINE